MELIISFHGSIYVGFHIRLSRAALDSHNRPVEHNYTFFARTILLDRAVALDYALLLKESNKGSHMH